MKWLYLSLTILLTAGANLLIKLSSFQRRLDPDSAGGGFWKMIASPLFLAGAACLAIALIPYSMALKKLELSVAYPVMTTSVMLLVSLCSIFILGESFTTVKLAGMIAIICGVVLLSI